jgi:DNA adenine methylase
MKTVRQYRGYQSTKVTDNKVQPLSAFGYYGGKKRLAAQIADFLDYRNTGIYAEPFGGSAAVLLNKAPHDREIYNESLLALCCFWRCMSDKAAAHKLVERLYDDTAFNKDVFDDYRGAIDKAEANGMKLTDLSDRDVMDLAVACFVVFHMSRDNGGLRFSSAKFPSTDVYHSRIGRLVEVAERVEGIEVKHGSAFDFLNDSCFNSPDVALYCDPPYLPDAVPGVYYRYNLDRKGHIRLLERLREMECRVLLSGYDDATHMYDNYLLDGGKNRWRRYEIPNYSTVTRGDSQRVEVLWCNYD